MDLRRRTAFNWRDHIGGEVALMVVLLIGGSALSLWQTSRQAEKEIDARTKARLRRGASAADNSAKAS